MHGERRAHVILDGRPLSRCFPMARAGTGGEVLAPRKIDEFIAITSESVDTKAAEPATEISKRPVCCAGKQAS